MDIRSVLRTGATAAVLAFLAACASTDQPATSPDATATAGSAPAASPVQVPAEPRARVALQRRLVARVEIDNPDALVEALGYLWVKTDDGQVVKVDPGTDRVAARRRIDTAQDPGTYCLGIGTDGRSVWACAARDTTTDVVQLDPRSLRPVRRVAAHKVFDQEHLPFVGGRLWVLGGDDGSRLVAVDPSTGVSTAYDLPTRCLQAAGSGTVLVVTCRNDDLVLRIDPDRGTVLATRKLPQPGFATVSGTQVWVDTIDGVQQLDAALRTEAVYAGLVLGLGGDLGADPRGNICARQQEGFLYRIDPVLRQVTEQVVGPDALSGGSVLCGSDAIWATAADDAALFHLRP